MATYTIKHDLYQTVLQTFYEKFDTEDQVKWDGLLKNAQEQGADANDLSELASEKVEDWLYLYKYVNSTDLSHQEEDDWISERDGTTELLMRIEDEDGSLIVEA